MLFNSYNFLIFFPIVTLIYYLIPHKIRYIWLLLASYYFYMCWNAKYALILLFSTGVTYVSGLFIIRADKIKEDKKRISNKKILVALSFMINLSILFLFKYFDFAVDNINRVLSYLNIQVINPSFDVILPVGISFYIFQALSYTVDVYRGDVIAERNFLKYALFVSFFPQLVAGPIERSKNLLKQVHEKHYFDGQRVKDGLLLMIWGGFQKIVIADRVAIFVDTVFNKFPQYGGMYIVVAAILFAFQIYCDFSGYSTIAIGAAKVMGFELMENFNAPYMSMSVAEFWRRWHISLSSWFRDYIYIPLGGNRVSKLKWIRNICVVWLLTGLWHGASWNFVLWGAYFAIILLIEKIFLLKFIEKSPKIIQWLYAIFLIMLGWVIFRCESMELMKNVLSKMFVYQKSDLLKFITENINLLFSMLFILPAIVVSFPIVPKLKEKFNKSIIMYAGYNLLILILFSINIVFLTSSSYNPFIYFRF